MPKHPEGCLRSGCSLRTDEANKKGVSANDKTSNETDSQWHLYGGI